MKKLNFAFRQLLVINIMSFNIINTGPTLRPVPWVTHQAVLFLDKFMQMHADARVLEFGCGSSTLWFAQRTHNLVSIEHAPEWFDYIDQVLRTNAKYFPVNLILHTLPYYNLCNNFLADYFDLILVDGRNRSGCIKHAIRILKPGGTLMLDNAERTYYQKAIALLAGWESVSTEQFGPDSCGFTYPGWKTNWYIKPL